MKRFSTALIFGRQRGMTLIEIMVALTISLFLLGGIIMVYTSTSQSYRMSQATSRLQETARFAFDILGADIRGVGHMGCFNPRTANPSIVANGFSLNPNPNPVAATGFSANIPLTGVDGDLPAWVPNASYIAGTDSITLRKASSSEVSRLTAGMLADPTGTATPDASVAVTIGSNTHSWQANQLLIIGDCNSADFFLASAAPSGTPVTIPHAATHNSTTSLSKPYYPDAQVMRYEQFTYYIRNNPDGQPSLYRQPWGTNSIANSEEVVEGVENMQITYGEDTDNDGTVDAFRAAGSVANWANVLSIRVTLLIRSVDDGITNAPQAYTFNGTTTTPGDRRIRRVFTATFGMRSRLP